MMKLTNNMFTIARLDEVRHAADIRLNADHLIYRAHFPGQPITPGVCIIKIILELAERFLTTPLRLQQVKNLKFIQPLSPVRHPEATILFDHLDLTDGTVKLRGSVIHGEIVFTKFSLIARLDAIV